MLGMCGLWKILGTTRALPVDLISSLPLPLLSQPPWYFSWSSHLVG